MILLNNTVSNEWTLDETLWQLASASDVDGIALFGSRAAPSENPVSDYDVLVLVIDPPVHIFQILTHIDGRMADVVLVEAATADQIIELDQPISAASFEGMFLQKMLAAQVIYDASGRLKRIQEYARNREAVGTLWLQSAERERYGAWFWQNHSLLHIKRMAQSDDSIYSTAVDLMLMSAIGGLCRAYFQVRELRWSGEKAALRYLQAHDAEFLTLLHECLMAQDRIGKLKRYEVLVRLTLQPFGGLWSEGITALWLREAPQDTAQIDIGLCYWERLLKASS